MCTHKNVHAISSGEAGPELKMEFLKEISTMKKISMGRCPHVVNMIGCCTLQEPLGLVLEYAAYGDLLEYLRTIRQRVSAVLASYCRQEAALIDEYAYFIRIVPLRKAKTFMKT